MTNSILAAVLIAIESSGNDRAVGDNGQARGALQIHREVVEDVNRVYGTRYTHRQMHERKVALAVLDRYLWLYARPERLGRPVTNEDRARIWNGGPDGWRSRATDSYAARFRRMMRRR